MKKLDFAWVFASFIIAAVAYITSFNIIVGAAVFVLYVLYYFLIVRRKFVQYYEGIDRVHCCYHFINSFIVTLSVKESLEDAYESGVRLPSKKFTEEVEQIIKLSVKDRIIYLRDYFNLSIYKMFLNILDLYEDQGGNILNMSDSLIRECTRTEKSLTESVSIGHKHIIEFLLLWILSFGILLFIRFGIQEFYLIMIKNQIFSYMLFGFFLICLASLHLFFSKYTNLTLKEDNGS